MLNGEPIGYAQSYVALEAGTDGGKKKPIQEYAGIDQSLANASQLGKGLEPSWFELWLSCCSMIPSHQDPNGPVAEQLASDPMLRESGV